MSGTQGGSTDGRGKRCRFYRQPPRVVARTGSALPELDPMARWCGVNCPTRLPLLGYLSVELRSHHVRQAISRRTTSLSMGGQTPPDRLAMRKRGHKRNHSDLLDRDDLLLRRRHANLELEGHICPSIHPRSNLPGLQSSRPLDTQPYWHDG